MRAPYAGRALTPEVEDPMRLDELGNDSNERSPEDRLNALVKRLSIRGHLNRGKAPETRRSGKKLRVLVPAGEARDALLTYDAATDRARVILLDWTAPVESWATVPAPLSLEEGFIWKGQDAKSPANLLSKLLADIRDTEPATEDTA